MSNKPFVKKPGEQFVITVEFVNSLPTGTSLSSVVLSAVDENGADISNTVLNSLTGVISGTKTLIYVKGGTTGQRAHIKVKAYLDDNYSILEENLIMKIVEDS